MKTRSKGQNTRVNSGIQATAPSTTPLSPQQVLHANCTKVLEYMETLGIDLGTFVHSIFYGNPESRATQYMKTAWKTFVQTDKFSRFLENIYHPPRPENGYGTSATSGCNKLVAFASNWARTTLTEELAAFSRGYEVDKTELIQAQTMDEITSAKLGNDMKSACPTLWGLLNALVGDDVAALDREIQKEKEEREEKKEREIKAMEAKEAKGASVQGDGAQEIMEQDCNELQEEPHVPLKPHPQFGTIMCIASLAYRKNRRKNKVQTVLSVYAHARHLNKAFHDLLHQLGILMSHSWTTEFVGILNEAKHQQAIEVAESWDIMMSHDNIKLSTPVRSQRGSNQSVSNNGSAITMYALPPSACVFHDPDNFGPKMRSLREARIHGHAPRLSWEDLSVTARLERVRKDYVMDVLDFLLKVPGMDKSGVLKSTKLIRIPGPKQLPHGNKHRTEMHMLPTVNIDESTYGGTSQIIRLVINYLKLADTEAKRNYLALERKIPWLGDQMTSLLCNGLQAFLNEAENPIERLDFLMFFFGGFHCEMALAAGTFEKSRGTSSGLATFARDVILLSRTGLNANMNKKRPDFHICDEFLMHELEARMRAAFFVESGCSTEAELFTWVESHTAEQVLTLADQVYSNHASMGALARLKRRCATDKVRPSIILTNQNLLRYYAYRHANKHGCIDRIEDLLPELFIFFCGSGNSNYAKELYYTLQALTHEVTPEMRDAILQHCLLVNMQGRKDSFYPVDQQQEHNNAGIRNYGPAGPNVTWEHHGKVTPVIPYFMHTIEHVEQQLAGQMQSHIHKDPKHEAEIKMLIRAHNEHKIHIEVPGQECTSNNTTKDCIAEGTRKLKERKLVEYALQREVYFTAISDEHIYSDLDKNSSNQPTQPLPSPASPLLVTSSNPPTPEALHELLEPLVLNQATTLVDLVDLAELLEDDPSTG
ncbi:hypothetical protein FRC06_000269 [Ceratobasidium sp. 370]|nr:hypothetical protein FRC06_000269 [Ceratobasidium sp. 370]